MLFYFIFALLPLKTGNFLLVKNISIFCNFSGALTFLREKLRKFFLLSFNFLKEIQVEQVLFILTS